MHFSYFCLFAGNQELNYLTTTTTKVNAFKSCARQIAIKRINSQNVNVVNDKAQQAALIIKSLKN